MEKFSVYDVSSEAIMNIAKVISSSTETLTFDKLKLSFEGKYKDAYLKPVLASAIQMKIIIKINDGYSVNSEYRDKIKQASKNDLIYLFRQALQDFPPFLLYADFLSKEYSSEESAKMIRGILNITSPANKVEKSLRIWGTESGLILKENDGYHIPLAEKGLPSTYVKNLVKALDNELSAKTFLIDTLSPEVYGCLTNYGMNITELSKALISYESDPKYALKKASDFFETFLHNFGNDIGVNLQGQTGVNSLVNELEKTQKIIKNQKHIGNGIGGCRNIASHGVDAQTQKPWTITPQAALAGAIMIPTIIRSYYLYVKKNQQEL